MNNKIFDKIMGGATKVATNKYILTLRDAFMLSFPLTMFGSILLLLCNFPFFSPETKTFFRGLFGHSIDVTMMMMAIFIVIGIGYYLYGYLNPKDSFNRLFCAAISLASFLILIPFTTTVVVEGVTEPIVVNGVVPMANLGAQGVFLAIITGYITTIIYSAWIRKNKFVIRLPKEVPPAVAKSFTAIIPATVILLFWTFWFVLFQHTQYGDAVTFVFELIQQPLTNIGTTYFATILISFLTQICWAIGLHGQNIVWPIITPIWDIASIENVTMFNAGIVPTIENGGNIVTLQFINTFTSSVGGTGLLAAMLVILVSSKNAANRAVAKLATTPLLFNIGEPALFGLPIVLNPIYAIPWILTGPIMITIAYFAMATGIVPLTTGVSVPWTMPIFLSGMLATNSLAGGILQLVQLAVVAMLWLPFIMYASKKSLVEIN